MNTLVSRVIELREKEQMSWREIARHVPASHMTCKLWYERERHKKHYVRKSRARPKQVNIERIFKRQTNPPHTHAASLVSPEGVIYERISSLGVFAKSRGLIHSNLYRVARGERQHHRGWTRL